MHLFSWIVTIAIIVVLIVAYVLVFLYARKRQKEFDAQYNAAKERHEVFVLNKKIVKERPKSKWMKYARFKTYQVVGRISVSQAVRGIQMSKMHTMTFQTTKSEYDKIQPNHKYKMDIAGNYIGYVHAPAPVKSKKSDAKSDKSNPKKGKDQTSKSKNK